MEATMEATKGVKAVMRLPAHGQGKDWGERHQYAVCLPKGAEKGIVKLLLGWFEYSAQHWIAYESNIGDDGVLGPAWARIGAECRTLLNGELGRLDGGSLDSVICRELERQGFDPDDLP